MVRRLDILLPYEVFMKMNSYFRLVSFVFALSFLLGSVSLAQSVSWKSLNGPSGVFSTLASGQDNAGYIFVSTFSPTNVYRSSDDGLTWEKSDLINQEVDGFATKDNGLMFAAAYYGVYKSIDHGMHWQLINDSINSNISIHISRHGIIYVGTWYQGLVKSIDDGATWTSAGLVGQVIHLVNSDSSGILFAGTDSGLYRSINGGNTWTKIDSLKYLITSIFIRSDNKIYATDSRNLYSSVDGGVTWKNIYTDQDGYFRIYQVSNDTLFGASYFRLVCSADDGQSWHLKKWLPYFMSPSSLIITRNHSLIVGLDQGGFLRSTDSGVSWKSVGNGMGFLPITAICSDSSGNIFVGAYQGVFICKKGKSEWENAVGIDSLVSPFVVSSLLQNRDGKLYAGGSGAIYSTQNQGGIWAYDAIGSIKAIIFSPSNAIIVANHWYDVRELEDFSAIYRLAYGGTSWNEEVYYRSYIYNFAVSKYGNIYACGGFGLIKSTDDGITWDKLSFTSDPIDLPFKAIVASPIGFLLCFNTGSVFVSYDEGKTWKSTCMLKGVSAAFAGSAGTIYAGTQGQGVFVSSDSGATWHQSNNGLNDVNISCLSIAADGTLLCGTVSGGVYRSFETVIAVRNIPSNIVTDYLLVQNYPNPFNPSTVIEYGLPVRSNVLLRIFNILGQQIATLYDGVQVAGYQKVQWDANVSTGIYFYRIEATAVNDPSKHFIDTKKMVLMR
jgi:photosystem II stability/assembly factor-like uncharacterized protein